MELARHVQRLRLAGLNNTQIYERLVADERRRLARRQLLRRLEFESAKACRRLVGYDAWHGCIAFGFWTPGRDELK